MGQVFSMSYRLITRGVPLFTTLYLVHRHVYEFTLTTGESMLPTINNHNDFIHILKLINVSKLQMGDVIILRKPTDPKRRVCKRITGMPGDIISIDPSCTKNKIIDDGNVSGFINDRKQDKIIDTTDDMNNMFLKVPKGHFWVTGDNLNMSLDSRDYGFVPMGLILGKVVAANNLNKPVYENGCWFGFRWLQNSYH